jgi:enamine deaminase RidA (YjgF/YER057c/UK114 family)
MAIKRIQTGPRMSQAVIYNKTVYLAGQVAAGATVVSAQLASAEYRIEVAVIAAQP